MKYFSELREILTEKEIKEEVANKIKKLGNLINEKTALFVLAKEYALVKESDFENPVYTIQKCKDFARQSELNDSKWITLEDCIIFSPIEIKTGAKNGKKWKLTSIEITDGIEDGYGGICFIKVRTFGSEFSKLDQYDKITIKNLLLEHKSFINDENKTVKTINYASLSVKKNTEIIKL